MSDSVPLPPDPPFPMGVRSIAPLLVDAIGRLHRGDPLDDLLALA